MNGIIANTGTPKSKGTVLIEYRTFSASKTKSFSKPIDVGPRSKPVMLMHIK